VKPVILPPGCARLETNPLPTGSVTITNTIAVVGAACRNAVVGAVPCAKTTSGAVLASSAAFSCRTARVAGGLAILDPDVATIPPTKVRERLRKRGNQGLLIGITLISSHQHADAPPLIRLLRACRKWPSSGRSAQQGDEVATLHSITSSAMASTP